MKYDQMQGEVDVSSAPTAMPPKGLTVPLSLLQTPDDSDEMQTPQKGDTGSCTVEYTLVDVQGDQAIIEPTTINGKPIAGDETESPEDTALAADAQEGSDLRTMAVNA